MSRRTQRVAKFIMREINNALLYEVSDPRLEYITITTVKITSDLQNATVFYSVLDKKNELAEVEYALLKATGFIQHYVMEKLDIRSAPNLHFKFDETLQNAARIENLIDKIEYSPQKNQTEQSEKTTENKTDE